MGYSQLAYLIRLDKSEHGHNYLCIDKLNVHDSDIYSIGKVVEDLEDIYVEDSTYVIENSPLYGTYLFDEFLRNKVKESIKHNVRSILPTMARLGGNTIIAQQLANYISDTFDARRFNDFMLWLKHVENKQIVEINRFKRGYR